MPVATAIALAYAAVGLRRRDRLLAPVGQDPAWLAALAGGLAAGVVGALVEDSGPVLLVVAVFALGCVATYLWGRPRVEAGPARRRNRSDRRNWRGRQAIPPPSDRAPEAGYQARGAAQSLHDPCNTISCSETASGTLSLRLSIARSRPASENGITTPHSSHTRWWWCSSCSHTRS